MLRRIRQVLNNKSGLTLLELIVSLLVLSVIITAATAIFLPIYRTYRYANNMAEVNTLLDNIAALVMEDAVNATRLDPGSTEDNGGFTLYTLYNKNGIKYTSDDGVIMRIDSINDAPLLAGRYYRDYKADVSCKYYYPGTAGDSDTDTDDDDDSGSDTDDDTDSGSDEDSDDYSKLIQITVKLSIRNNALATETERTYYVRPVAMQ